MTLVVRRFAGAAREMVGLLQQPDLTRPDQPAFLLCKPFGQEAIRTSQMFQALARRLAREGSPVLRFDYHGTGDSPGEGADQTLAGWVEDTLAATAQLLGDAPNRPLVLFGIGLGATIAARAALRLTTPPLRLVLWEPVLDGRAYLDALLNAHRRELARELQTPWEYLVRTGRESEPQLPGNVIGFDLGEELTREIGALDASMLRPLVERRIAVHCALRDDQRAHAVTSPDWRIDAIQTPIDWMSGDARGTAIVPQEILLTLLAAGTAT